MEIGSPYQPSGSHVLATLRRAVTDRGREFVYKKRPGSGLCTYTRPDEQGQLCPDCGVGVVLHALGVPIQELAQLDDRLTQGTSGSVSIETVQLRTVHLNVTSRALLSAFQRRQDQGVPWGQALEAAELVYQVLETTLPVTELVRPE